MEEVDLYGDLDSINPLPGEQETEEKEEKTTNVSNLEQESQTEQTSDTDRSLVQLYDTATPAQGTSSEDSMSRLTVQQRAHIQKVTRNRGGSNEPPAGLFVGNLQWWTTDQELETLCGQFGTVEEVRFFENKANGKSREFALVIALNRDNASSIIAGLQGKELNGRPLLTQAIDDQTLRHLSHPGSRSIYRAQDPFNPDTPPPGGRGRGRGYNPRYANNRHHHRHHPGHRSFPPQTGFPPNGPAPPGAPGMIRGPPPIQFGGPGRPLPTGPLSAPRPPPPNRYNGDRDADYDRRDDRDRRYRSRSPPPYRRNRSPVRDRQDDRSGGRKRSREEFDRDRDRRDRSRQSPSRDRDRRRR